MYKFRNRITVIMTTLIILCFIFLEGTELDFKNGRSYNGELVKATKESVFIVNDDKLIIIAGKLIISDVLILDKKLNYNSYIEIVRINSLTDLDELMKREHSLTEKPNRKSKGRNFLFLEGFARVNGLGFGTNYEYAFSPISTISLGVNKGGTIASILFSVQMSDYISIPLTLKYVPLLEKHISPELGVSIEYVKWKTYEESLFGGGKEIIEDGEGFSPSMLLGLRFQPQVSGLAMKSGCRLSSDFERIGLNFYTDIGFKF